MMNIGYNTNVNALTGNRNEDLSMPSIDMDSLREILPVRAFIRIVQCRWEISGNQIYH
jgi:hypothetical protein